MIDFSCTSAFELCSVFQSHMWLKLKSYPSQIARRRRDRVGMEKEDASDENWLHFIGDQKQ